MLHELNIDDVKSKTPDHTYANSLLINNPAAQDINCDRKIKIIKFTCSSNKKNIKVLGSKRKPFSIMKAYAMVPKAYLQKFS